MKQVSLVSLIFLLGCTSQKDTTTEHNTSKTNPDHTYNASAAIKKYASLLGVTESELGSEMLYAYIDGWMGVPYKWGGQSKQGVDCSGLVQAIYKEVYNISLERSAHGMVKQCQIIKKGELSEGDLVLFDISGQNSHVGLYLVNDHFVHASSSKGVIISKLSDSYYVKHWGRAARFDVN